LDRDVDGEQDEGDRDDAQRAALAVRSLLSLELPDDDLRSDDFDERVHAEPSERDRRRSDGR
jgi:hypothetical protein